MSLPKELRDDVEILTLNDNDVRVGDRQMGQGRDARAGRRLRERLGEVGADLAERRDAAATDLAGRVVELLEPVLARVVLAVERALT